MFKNVLLQINVAADTLATGLEVGEKVPTEETITVLQLLIGGGYIMIPLSRIIGYCRLYNY